MRAIINKLFRKISPFDGLVEHAEKVIAGTGKFKEAINAYLDKDYERFESFSDEVIKLENEADLIKGNIRNHLHKSVFMPVSRGVFLACLKEQDSILDSCEDAVIWMQFMKSDIDSELKVRIGSYLNKVVEMVDSLEDLVRDVHKLIVSVSAKERKIIKEKIKEIHSEETQIDEMQRALIKTLFSSGKEMLHIYHLIHVVFILGKIADSAENVGDFIRVMMAR